MEYVVFHSILCWANAKTDAKAAAKRKGMAPEIKHHLNISSIFLLQLFFLSIITWIYLI